MRGLFITFQSHSLGWGKELTAACHRQVESPAQPSGHTEYLSLGEQINSQLVWVWEGRDNSEIFISPMSLGSGDNLFTKIFEDPLWV